MFSNKRGGKSLIKLFIEQWIDLFKEVKQELGNFWRKHCPMCICKNHKKNK